MKKLLTISVVALFMFSQSYCLSAASPEALEITDVKLCRNTDENRKPINVTS